MKTDTPSLADLEARLEKLERQNRRLKRVGLLFLLIAGAGFLLAQVPRKPARAAPVPAARAATYDTLVVHRLELRDEAGKLRGVWNTTDEDATFWLNDTAGKPRALLVVSAYGPSLQLYDAAEKTRAALNVVADVPGLWLADAAGKPRARLYEGRLSVTDAQGFKAIVGVADLQTVMTGESHTTSAAAVTLFGKDHEVIWRAP
jgi:hypothetical protein